MYKLPLGTHKVNIMYYASYKILQVANNLMLQIDQILQY